MKTANGVHAERRRRQQVAVWAYSYEVLDQSLVPDHVFDRVCREIDVLVPTGHSQMDNWFKTHFSPHTGQWVHKHPDQKHLHRIANLLLEEELTL